MFKTVLLVCAQALFIQSIAGKCLGAGFGLGPLAAEAPLAAANWADMAAGAYAASPYTASWCAGGSLYADGYGPASVAASHGGALPIASSSSIPASGVSIRSDNAFEGPLAVAGALPFLGTVALEGALPTAGAGAVAYGAGNGEVAVLSEDIGAAGFNGLAGPLSYRAGALGYAGGPLGYNAELIGSAIPRAGCGCGSRFF